MDFRGNSCFTGKDIAKPYLLFTLLSFFVFLFFSANAAACAVWTIAYTLYVFFLLFYAVVSGLRFGVYAFRFDATFGDFFVMNIKGLFFSMITLGIYTPWYAKQFMTFVVSRVSVNGRRLQFNGTVKRFWKLWFFAWILPVAVLSLLVVFFVGHMLQTENALYYDVQMTGPDLGYYAETDHAGYIRDYYNHAVVYFASFVLIAVVCFIAATFWCLLIGWCTTISVEGKNGEGDRSAAELRFAFSLPKASCFVALQILLALASFGFLSPVSMLNIYRYCASRTHLYAKRGNGVAAAEKIGGFKVAFNMVEGFFVLFFHSLLTTLTLGFYFPWGQAAIVRFFVCNTWLEIDTTKKIGEGRLLPCAGGGADTASAALDDCAARNGRGERFGGETP